MLHKSAFVKILLSMIIFSCTENERVRHIDETQHISKITLNLVL